MKTWEAIKALEEGKILTRIDWPKERYLYLHTYPLGTTEYLDSFGRTYYFDCSDDGWVLYPRKMNFIEAMKAVKDGKSVRMPSWPDHQFLYVRKSDGGLVMEDGISLDLGNIHSGWEEI